jgi:ParB family chromosome partitioning protein
MARETGRKHGKGNGRETHARDEKNADLIALEKRISDSLGLAVNIENSARGGTLTIRYRNFEQLDEVLRRLEKKH